MSEISRQQFLKILAAGGASLFGMAPQMFGQTKLRGPLLPWARLKYTCRGNDDDDWNVHPNGDLNLIDSMHSSADLNVEKKWNVAEISKLETMTQFPFLFMHSELAPQLADSERANLREYLLRGGFLFAEDCVVGKNRSDRSKDEFFRRMAETELGKILPDAKLERLPVDHPVFQGYFRFGQIPHMQGIQHGMHGITINGRLAVLLSPSDTHCGWTNGDSWFGAGKQQEACRLGINIYLHAMTQEGGLAAKLAPKLFTA